MLERLNAWYSSLPESFRLPNWSKSVSGLAPYPTSIHFAYMVLVLFVYRALLRPMARSSSPPLIFDLEEMPTNPDPNAGANPELDASADVNGGPAINEGEDPPLLDCFDMPEIESFPAVDLTDHGTGETILNAAERCASIMVSFTRRLTSSDFVGFWYSCKFLLPLCLLKLFSAEYNSSPVRLKRYPNPSFKSSPPSFQHQEPKQRKLIENVGSRISFATVSNFLLLLLIQAPNADRALKGKQLVESWLRVLRCQSQSFPMMKLGLTRLDAVHWVGLEQTFVLPGHVAEVIQSRQGTS